MYHTSSLVVPDGGSGGPSKEDGLKTGSGSGGSKDLELSGGKGPRLFSIILPYFLDL